MTYLSHGSKGMTKVTVDNRQTEKDKNTPINQFGVLSGGISDL